MYFLKSLKRSLVPGLSRTPHRASSRRAPASRPSQTGSRPCPRQGNSLRGCTPWGPLWPPQVLTPAGLPPSLGRPGGCSCSRPSLPRWELPGRLRPRAQCGATSPRPPPGQGSFPKSAPPPPLLIPVSLGPPGSGHYPNPTQLSVPPRLPIRPMRSHPAWSSAQPAPSGSFF